MCLDCYVDTNLPTIVQDSFWVYIQNSTRSFSVKDRHDAELRVAITEKKLRISIDRKTIVLDVDGKKVSVPVIVEKLDELAKKSGVLIGKWLIHRDKSEIDYVWKIIAKSTFKGELGTSAKVSTAMKKSRRHVICVYTENYLDLEDVMRVREKLRQLGFTEELCYKPDIYTYLGIYYRTTRLSPCRYRK